MSDQERPGTCATCPTYDVQRWPDGWRYMVRQPNGMSEGWMPPFVHKQSAKRAALRDIARHHRHVCEHPSRQTPGPQEPER